MTTKWNAQDVIDSLINGQFKQAKSQTLEGLDELLSDDSVYAKLKPEDPIDTSPIRKYQVDTLAYRICTVMLKLPSGTEYYSLRLSYRKLFE